MGLEIFGQSSLVFCDDSFNPVAAAGLERQPSETRSVLNAIVGDNGIKHSVSVSEEGLAGVPA